MVPATPTDEAIATVRAQFGPEFVPARIAAEQKVREFLNAQLGVLNAEKEAITLLRVVADDLDTAMQRFRQLAYAILDGTLIPIDRVADQKPHNSGMRKRHGFNVQVIADAAGRLTWASPALPGSAHDLTAARTHGIIDALTSADMMTFADKGYQAPAVACAPRSSGAISGRSCHAGRRPPTAPTQRFAPAANEPSRRSNLEDSGQAALLPPPGHRDRAGRPRAAPRRSQPLHRMKMAPYRFRDFVRQ